MVLVEVIPGTKLPLGKAQRYSYRAPGPLDVGQIVSISLGSRNLTGIVTAGKPSLPQGIRAKPIKALPWKLPAIYFSLALRLAQAYRTSEGLWIKLFLAGAGLGLPQPTGQTTTKKRGVPALSPEQVSAIQTISQNLGTSKGFLLESLAGSDKSGVYAKIAERILGRGGQVLLLVPEIANATHLVEQLRFYLGNLVEVWHSTCSKQERTRIWQRAITGKAFLLVGPRSALFVPMARLACIIIDEEHEQAYKQWDQEPRFSTHVVTHELSRLSLCPLVLASPTPSIETWNAARDDRLRRLTLSTRLAAPMPQIELIDTRGSPAKNILSPISIEALHVSFSAGTQSLVLINRRGAAPVLKCAACTHVWRCKSCERALVTHLRPHALLSCHFCETTSPLPERCSTCGSRELRFIGIGTERVESELRRLLPAVAICRLDANLVNGSADILVGTPLAAKSWGLKRLGLAIVLEAEQGLLVPDFRAHEHTVQLLWQLASRIAESVPQGRLLIETGCPDHAGLRAIQQHDYAQFITQELAERRRYGYPPFRRLVTFYRKYSDDSHLQIEDAAQKIRQALLRQPNITLLPTRIKVLPRGKKIAQVTCLAADPQALFVHVPLDWKIDLDPSSS
ncbi:MAG: primosomal protein N' [Parcubacteria group bacterium]